MRQLLVLLLVFGGLLAAPGAAHAGSYEDCTGFIDSLPTTISTQGTWCLRGHLSTAITSGNAITINTNNVTIDCHHFKIGGLADWRRATDHRPTVFMPTVARTLPFVTAMSVGSMPASDW